MMFSFLLLLFYIPLIISDNNTLVYVNTTRGQVVGIHVDYGNNSGALYHGQADEFLGIPYVLPPIRSNRFQKPKRIDSFGQTWNATFLRPRCPQPDADPNTLNEDCLYLNVLTPQASNNSKYPVMFWIHGGALQIGSAVDYAPPGVVTNLVSRGVVVVSFNYRIGMLGFFTTMTDDFPPNLGLLDQVEALKFANEEISNFGGDPSKITIFGESAGGCSVSAHTYSPLSKGLFQQAIIESGVVWTCIDYSTGNNADEFAFWEIAYMVQEHTRNLTDFNQTAFEQDLSNGFPILMKNVPNAVDILSNIYMPHGQNQSDHLYWLNGITDAITGAAFTAFTAREVDFYLKNNNTNVYLYEFTWSSPILDYKGLLNENYPPGYQPAIHAAELPYVLMSPNIWAVGAAMNTTSPTDFLLLNIFGEFWTNFAKNGTPSLNNSWTPVTNKNAKEYYELGATQGMRSGFRNLDSYVWNELIPGLVGNWPIIPDQGNSTNDSSSTAIPPTTSPSFSPSRINFKEILFIHLFLTIFLFVA